MVSPSGNFRSRRVLLSALKLSGLLLGSITLGLVWGFCLTYFMAGILLGELDWLTLLAGSLSMSLGLISMFYVPKGYDFVFECSRQEALMDWVGSSGPAGWMFTKAVPELFALVLPISLFSHNPVLPYLPGALIILFWSMLVVGYEMGHDQQA